MMLDTGRLEDDFNKGASQVLRMLKLSWKLKGLHRQYAEDGACALIICAGSSQMQALARVAADFPERRSAIIDGAVEDKVGVDVDQRYFTQDNALVSVIKGLDTAVFSIIKEAIERYLAQELTRWA